MQDSRATSQENLSVLRMFVLARMPNSTSYVKVDVDVSFKLWNANPSLEGKGYLKPLV